VGNPMLYKTTKEFLVQFGLKDLSELPTLKEFEELGRLSMGESSAEDAEPQAVNETVQNETALEEKAE
jgi:segregation and condensation protein B